MTVADRLSSADGTRPRHALGSASSGSGSRPTGRSSRACASASRATSGASRSASAELGGDVVSAGLVDTAQGAREAGDRFAPAQVDLVLCHAVTYATSSTVLPVVQAAKAPVVLLGLQPTATLDYANIDTGEWLANCAACCVPEIAGAFTRARIPYDTVAGTIDDDERAWAKIGALGARRRRGARAAARRGSASSGTCIPGCSTCTPTSPPCTRRSARTSRCWRSTTSARACSRSATTRWRPRRTRSTRCSRSPTRRTTRSPGRSSPTQLDWSARVAVGLDRLVADFELDALTYYYRGVDGNEAERLGAGVIVGNSLLTARGVPTVRRGRPQDEPRPADPRPARRGRLLHRVLRARLRRAASCSWATTGRATSRSRRSSRRCARSSSTTASAAPG